jgi:hypothetical protein
MEAVKANSIAARILHFEFVGSRPFRRTLGMLFLSCSGFGFAYFLLGVRPCYEGKFYDHKKEEAAGLVAAFAAKLRPSMMPLRIMVRR